MRWFGRTIARMIAAALMLAVWSGCEREPGPGRGGAVVVKEIAQGANYYRVVEVDLQRAQVRLFWKRADGQHYRTFEAVRVSLAASGQRLLFATNAGIFEPGYTACGLHVEEGRELVPLNRAQGSGNFYLKPNGVFLIDEAGARIVESSRYAGTTPGVRLATQSGPLLVMEGQIHPRFATQSENRRIRSGVGVSSGAQVVFAVSRQPVTFHEFASLFRDQLGCPNALYLDGEISRFYCPGERVEEAQGEFAGMLGVVGKGP